MSLELCYLIPENSVSNEPNLFESCTRFSAIAPAVTLPDIMLWIMNIPYHNSVRRFGSFERLR